MSKKEKRFFVLSFFIICAVILGYFIFNVNNKKFDLEDVKSKANEELITFKSNVAPISFSYPSSFFVEENTDTITVSPLSPNDPKKQSSVGIESNLVISFSRGENLENTPVRTQRNQVNFYEKETEYKGFPALIQSYIGAYAGEKHFILLVEYQSTTDNGVIYVHYSETYKDVYEKVIGSIIFNN